MSKQLTPLMRQYHEIKHTFPDALVLFQVGDFYEFFFEDAHKASTFLGITLTKRGSMGNEPIPLCGVPVHSVDRYLVKLVKGGFRVVLVDQLSKPQPGKLVKRGVTQVLTPGTLTELTMLEEKSASYIAAIYPLSQAIGLVFAELLTGQLFVTMLSTTEDRLLLAELARFLPDEVIIPDSKFGKQLDAKLRRAGYITTSLDEGLYASFDDDAFGSWLSCQCSQETSTLINHSEALSSALRSLYQYLKRTFETGLSHCKQVVVYNPEDYVILDVATQRNLEIVANLQDSKTANTLFSVMDRAVTAMGSRQIKKWLLRPLTSKAPIEQRLDAVEVLANLPQVREQIKQHCAEIGDIERVVGRIALDRAHLNDYLALKQGLDVLEPLSRVLVECGDVKLMHLIRKRLAGFNDLYWLLNESLNDLTDRDWLIKEGYHAELDRLRKLIENSTGEMLVFEQREQKASGIPSLKVRFNKMHGYAIEITKANLANVPPHYIRTQTLSNRERFTTQELKDLEYDIQRAQASIKEIETEVFAEVAKKVTAYVPPLKKCAHALAHLDALIGFSIIAVDGQYVRPTFNANDVISIKAGRHPVVERASTQTFIPNDTILTPKETLWVITGPNMGGKSTFLRQTALITLMSQAGSFVPAASADIALVDRIFTRIGAGDNVAAGKSTFMVEMEEAALICTQATQKSLVILDEIGRGTSTYDGLALAQAILEYIYETVGCKCLFATHYHELTSLADTFESVASYHAASKEMKDSVVLLHKIIKGVAKGSYGIEVAKQAGIPTSIVKRAEELVGSCEV